ncbi:hypothetical protein Kfla_3299 [Kribbella flavida DSM 17836]|uniref:Lipoprotein n=1 Tax=Kribbella flavida (strain DSM 17836 / JCM 10339 / NBRC 14399) TaxID=479435 RepID=D2PKP3_KRIFD|nr:hypothetical protein [Kribbella flavida]ADB32360.1 hypothetical protein Kfla_3299 [Kribbella flavida DSM 17836]
MRASATRAAAVVLASVLIAACSNGAGSGTGRMPEGVEEQPAGPTTITLPTPTGEPSRTPRPSASTPAKPAKPPAASGARVVVVPGRFGAEPAVQGLVAKYPLYYQALVQRDSDLVKTNFPAFFYADTAINIDAAKASGWVMRPPGSIVVVGTSKQPYGVVRLNLCRSQRLQWWNPKTRKFVVNAPRGTAEAIDMVRTGLGWTMYKVVRPVPTGINCSAVRYPA